MRGLKYGAAALLGAMGLFVGFVMAGDTSPPTGPVAGTMKTLDEVEPRIPIGPATTPGDADSTYRIDSPGSYYFIGDVTGVAGERGIEIASSDVSIDLMGYTMQGVAGSLQGIATQGGAHDNLTVRNGVVRDWGSSGVDLGLSGLGILSLVEDMIASDNGAHGVRNNLNGTIRNCVADSNSGNGIHASGLGVVEGCTGRFNSGIGILADDGSTVSNCSSTDNVSHGFDLGSGSTMTQCAALSNEQKGINATTAATIVECSLMNNEDDGIRVGPGATVLDCTLYSNANAGIRGHSSALIRGNTLDANETYGIFMPLGTFRARIESNHVVNNSVGIDIDGAGHFIIGNTVGNNITNFDIVANNFYGPIVDRTAVGVAPVVGNSAPSSLATTDPWANFAY